MLMLICAAGISCGSAPSLVGMESMMRPSTSPMASSERVTLRGSFVRLTDFPCHRSDPYVGNETVTFVGSDGSRTTIVTGSANRIGLPADPPESPLGQCRQVARYEVVLPIADRYVVSINDRKLAPVSLAELEREGLRHTFHLPS